MMITSQPSLKLEKNAMENKMTILEIAKQDHGIALLDEISHQWKTNSIEGLANWLAGAETALNGSPLQEIADELFFLRQVVNRMDWVVYNNNR